MKHIAIKENHLYSKTYAKGKKFVGKNVIVYILKDYKAGTLMKANPMKLYINRIGITVSKKLGHATERNRVKRILREGLRQTEKEYSIKKGFLIVLVARNSACEAKSDAIKKDISKAFFALDMILDNTEENNNEKNS